MAQVAVVYWTMTGNTQAMAEAIAAAAGTEAVNVADFDAATVGDYDAFAFGCPAMGAEELEHDEFEPVWDAATGGLSGKPVALFGSYDWGDGEWMRTWEEAAKDAGVNVVETCIANLDPDDDALAACAALGKKLAG